MKLGDIKHTDVDGNDDFDGVEAQISQQNTGYIFDLVSRQMYRRPIESIVREITSNCFDAHIAAKIDDAVVITMDEDETGHYISFKDVGIGMSPDVIKNIYMSLGESNKRLSNDFIGAFGLTCKKFLYL